MRCDALDAMFHTPGVGMMIEEEGELSMRGEDVAKVDEGSIFTRSIVLCMGWF